MEDADPMQRGNNGNCIKAGMGNEIDRVYCEGAGTAVIIVINRKLMTCVGISELH